MQITLKIMTVLLRILKPYFLRLQFRKILNRELKESSEAGNGASEVSAWVYNTFIGKLFVLIIAWESTHKFLLQKLGRLLTSVSLCSDIAVCRMALFVWIFVKFPNPGGILIEI